MRHVCNPPDMIERWMTQVQWGILEGRHEHMVVCVAAIITRYLDIAGKIVVHIDYIVELTAVILLLLLWLLWLLMLLLLLIL